MSDVLCQCGHPESHHKTVQVAGAWYSGQRWCEHCQCEDFEPAGADRGADDGRS